MFCVLRAHGSFPIGLIPLNHLVPMGGVCRRCSTRVRSYSRIARPIRIRRAVSVFEICVGVPFAKGSSEGVGLT